MLNPRNSVVRACTQLLCTLMVMAIAAAGVWGVVSKPKERQLALPDGTLSGPALAKYLVCLDQVLYISRVGAPEAALVGADGRAQACRAGDSVGIESFNYRYRTYCVEGVEVVKLYRLRDDTIFVRYDPQTLLPAACKAE